MLKSVDILVLPMLALCVVAGMAFMGYLIYRTPPVKTPRETPKPPPKRMPRKVL